MAKFPSIAKKVCGYLTGQVYVGPVVLAVCSKEGTDDVQCWSLSHLYFLVS